MQFISRIHTKLSITNEVKGKAKKWTKNKREEKSAAIILFVLKAQIYFAIFYNIIGQSLNMSLSY